MSFGKTEVAGGLFYYGDRVPLPNGSTKQYAVNPGLPSNAATPDVEGSSFSYWPSYADISPAARRAFLDWMRSGRRDPAYGIGFVFIFFYGLEHRVFVEKGADTASIIQEVERLLAIYGSNHSFHGYATNFLNFARISQGIRLAPPPLSPERVEGLEMGLATRLYLGERLLQSPSLSAEDALRWVLASPETYLRTPAVRCFDELFALWKLRFGQHFPRGFVLNVKSRVSLRYRAASAAFEVEVPGAHQEYPDPSRATKRLEALRKLVAECTDELDAFSRLVGRKPSERRSMAAVALLPVDLQRMPEMSAVEEFRRQVDTVLGSQGTASSTARVLLDMAGIAVPADGKISAISADALGRALGTIDVAIEPDCRYGSSVPRADEQVLIFRAASGGPIDSNRPAFRATRAQVEVAVLAAAADGEASHEELERTIALIKKATKLSQVEQARLIAFALTTFNSPPKQARVIRKLAEMNASEREAIADAAISVIGGSQNIDANEVKFLERLHKSLGLPKERVYSGLHRAAVPVDELVSLTEESRAAGVPIPKEEPAAQAVPSASGIQIDVARLEKTRKETESVSALLANIFAEEDAPAAATAAPTPETSLEGLDGPHAELLEMLEARGSMTRVEFEQIAKAVRLLPDGAIERINDWSFDRFDEPLIEEGDDVAIVPHLRARIAEIRVETA